MAIIKSLNGKTPKIGANCFLAETAVIIGDVEIGDNCSIWYNAVLRGDVHYIRIGNNSNVQDGAIIHGTYKKSPTNIGNFVTIAHGATIHGCTIHDNVEVGMRAIVLDDAEIESDVIIGAGAVVTKGTKVEGGAVYAGIPARKIKELSPQLRDGELRRIAQAYSMYADWYKEPEQ
ncbi:MAG: gamma carbonic anhydrase family protein [Bacteroidales bacterium]|jgi:carbonic anhydrase/acetyltransferase-like protein (isoleucine patch superfamily)|nr:gamma carbonic anhydrase family protein [Bacteroidales bacterium]